MSDIERAVTLSRKELGVIAGLANQHDAVTVAIREQRIDDSDGHTGPWREGRTRSYVVTLYGPADPAYSGSGPTPLQLLLISGPEIGGSVDVVLLTNRSKGSEVSA